jgi:transposase
MATTRLPMRHLREIFRQKYELKRSHRQIARSVGVSSGGVAGASSRAKAVGLDWAQIQTLGDEALEERLYGPRGGKRDGRAALPDAAYLNVELRKPGVTLQLLHLEYLEKHANGYRYTAFCRHYSEWLAKQSPTMRQVHHGGEKLFVDYSGKKPRIVDPATGEVTEVELFVAVLGASNFTYAEATRTQQVPDWIGSHVRTLSAIGGVPRAVVPDQLKSGVTLACRYEPGIQRSYEELAQHYGTVILPRAPRTRAVESSAGAVTVGAGSSCFRPLSRLRRCLIPRHGSVSSARSSNRTCGSPASGSHLDRHAFALGELRAGTMGR